MYALISKFIGFGLVKFFGKLAAGWLKRRLIKFVTKKACEYVDSVGEFQLAEWDAYIDQQIIDKFKTPWLVKFLLTLENALFEELVIKNEAAIKRAVKGYIRKLHLGLVENKELEKAIKHQIKQPRA